MDFGHVPLFAMVLILLDGILGRLSVALCLSIAIAVLVELVQHYVGRSSSLMDVVNGVAGTVVGALWRCDSAIARFYSVSLKSVSCVIVLLIPFMDAAPTFRNVVWASTAFPNLCDFQSKWQLVNWHAHQATIAILPYSDHVDSPTGFLTLLPGNKPYSGALFLPVVNDWSAYNWLCIELHSTDYIDMDFTIRDDRKSPTVRERFSSSRHIEPGENRIRFSLVQIKNSPLSRPLNLKRIMSVDLWVNAPSVSKAVYIRKIYLQ
jgi:hypothetical protein